MLITTGRSFALSDSLLDNGNYGVRILPSVSSLEVMISNTIIRNIKGDALGGQVPVGGAISFHMRGGEISNNASNGAQLTEGTWQFTDVRIHQNTGLAIYLQDGEVIMRGCRIIGNGHGINVFDNGRADLGTSASPGNNEIRDNASVGLSADGNFGATLIEAVGNTWKPRVQGADDNGKYPTTETIGGPIQGSTGNNYALGNGWTLRR
jgi:hypothetical protein